MLHHVTQTVTVTETVPTEESVAFQLRATPQERAAILVDQLLANPQFAPYQENLRAFEFGEGTVLQAQLGWLYQMVVLPVGDLNAQRELKAILLSLFDQDELKFALFQLKLSRGMAAYQTQMGAALIQDAAEREHTRQTQQEGVLVNQFTRYMDRDEQRMAQLQTVVNQQTDQFNKSVELLQACKRTLDEFKCS